MNRNFYYCTLFIGAFYLLSSCSRIIFGIYGLEDPQPMSDTDILELAMSYNIPETDLYKIDSSFSNYIHGLDSSYDQSLVQNHIQPLQALYFDNEGQLLSYQVNCYAGGLPNLKWNRNNNMGSFPPKQQAPLDKVITFEKQIDLLKPLASSQQISIDKIDNLDYIVFVYWSQLMGRQNEHFFETIQQNCALAEDKNVKIVYVNNDQLLQQ